MLKIPNRSKLNGGNENMTRDEDDKFKCHYSRSSCCATYEEELFNENKLISYDQI